MDIAGPPCAVRLVLFGQLVVAPVGVVRASADGARPSSARRRCLDPPEGGFRAPSMNAGIRLEMYAGTISRPMPAAGPAVYGDAVPTVTSRYERFVAWFRALNPWVLDAVLGGAF